MLTIYKSILSFLYRSEHSILLDQYGSDDLNIIQNVILSYEYYWDKYTKTI